MEAGYIGEADRRVETVFTAIVDVGDGVNGFTAWFTAHQLTTMLFAKIHNAASDCDEDQDRYEEAEDFGMEVKVDDIESPGLNVASGLFRFVVVDGFVNFGFIGSDDGFAGTVAGVANSVAAVEEQDENEVFNSHGGKGEGNKDS